ncbi:hypothetical protein E3N88_07188 [Mikania micrantha]|uniref:Uncharacterized protein n=1 Tax=Mikania micrantha TaxID=192012 RepID=A0A5N6PRV4_9ASTR|nr:hypothetical protein E3N88_07188 [Mikania micrantha]
MQCKQSDHFDYHSISLETFPLDGKVDPALRLGGFPIETNSNRGDSKVRDERLNENRTPRAMNRTWTARNSQIFRGLTLEHTGKNEGSQKLGLK